MKSLKSLVSGIALSTLASVSFASVISVEAVVTADNHYALYYGTTSGLTHLDSAGSEMRNELGRFNENDPCSGSYNWSCAETWNFEMQAGDDIYVAAWSDNSIAQAFIGQFTVNGTTYFTEDNDDWAYISGEEDLNSGDAAPTTGRMQTLISGGGSWGPLESVNHGDNPWGYIEGISRDAADWVWGTPNLNGSGSGEGEFQVFRFSVPVSEPSTLALLGLGLLSLVYTRRRTQQS
jgi:hypothetical protein